MRLPLTPKQKAVYDFLVVFIQEHGYSPSLAEIGVAFGMTSPASTYRIVESLKEKGWITRRKFKERSIAIVGEPGCCRTCGRPFPDAEEDAPCGT